MELSRVGLVDMVGQSTTTCDTCETISEEQCGILLPLSCVRQEHGESPSERIDDDGKIDIGLIHLYVASCLYAWDRLPGYTSYIYGHGGTVEHVQACIRHLVVFSGYGPCLAAMSALKKKGAIPHNTPGKISTCHPDHHGNAFSLVYDGVETSVRKKVYDADPVLEHWIQNHLYGDVYSSPGLSLLQKQYLTVAGLVKSNMMEQLYGHAFAALRFGATEEFLKGIVDIVKHITSEIHGSCRAMPSFARAKRVIDMAVAKIAQTRNKGVQDIDFERLIEVTIGDPSAICIPDLPFV